MNTTVTGQDALVVLDTTPGGSAPGLRDRFTALTALAVTWQDGDRLAGDRLAGDSLGGQKTVLIYPSPYSLFLRGMQDNIPPSQTVADWRALAETVLALYRKRRATTFLLESDAVMQAADMVQARLARWTGTDDLPGGALPDAAPVAEEASCRLLAAHALLSSHSLRRLNDELAAGGFALRTPLDDAPEALDAVFALRGQCSAALAAQDAAAQQAKAREAELTEALATATARLAALDKDHRTVSERAALVPGLQQKTAALQEMLEQELAARKAQQTADASAAQQAKAREAELTEALATATARLAALDKDHRTVSERAALVPGLQQKTAALQEMLEQELTARKAQQTADATAAQQAKARETALTEALAAATARLAALDKDHRTVSERAALVPGLQQKTATLQELLEQEFTAHKAQQAAAETFRAAADRFSTQDKPHLERQISDLTAALAAAQHSSAAAAAEVQDLVAKLAAHLRHAARQASDNEAGLWSQTALVAERDQALAVRAADIAALQAEAGQLRGLLAARDRQIADQTAVLHDQAETLRLKQVAIDELKQSTSWKITQPLRVARGSIGRS